MTKACMVAVFILASGVATTQEAIFCDDFDHGRTAAWSNTPGLVSPLDCSVESWNVSHGDSLVHSGQDGFGEVGAALGDAQEFPEYQLWGLRIRSFCIDIHPSSSYLLEVAIKVEQGQDTSCYVGYEGFTDSSCIDLVHGSLYLVNSAPSWTASSTSISTQLNDESIRVLIRCSSSFQSGSDFLVLFDDVSLDGPERLLPW